MEADICHGYPSANNTKFSEQVSLKHLQEHILLMSKSEHILSYSTPNPNLNLFSENNYKKQAHI